ncbi:putative quinol monooxygenase [Streptomyces sp. Ag109_G2-15]|uniref:putative quinol monooxygenase n=1 Tax=Streptomyces sp. Ag109_G2-15 TaxID=1938850 RepID=UPI000BCCB032|nr:antibiotic biosynthesis monooxygenase [Streptomyces sp. Ag109_G2-15]SOE06785.1 Quinol monooxygenase YgiN [Streptomyces sp. Ag109_G2-15]
MNNIGLLARIEAKPEHADEIARLLTEARQLAEAEKRTLTWFAFREDATTFGIFDTFENDEDRAEHLRGRIAAALMGAAETMLASPPDIRPVDLLAVKLP